MSSLNKVMLIGRLGRDPELKYSQSGMAMCNLSLATDESYTDRDGNKVPRTEWHRVTVFQRAAENCNTYLKKGSLVFVEGGLTTRKWQDQQGVERYTTEIKAQRVQFLDRKQDGQGDGQQPGDQSGRQQPQAQRQQSQQSRGNDDYGGFPPETSDIDQLPF